MYEDEYISEEELQDRLGYEEDGEDDQYASAFDEVQEQEDDQPKQSAPYEGRSEVIQDYLSQDVARRQEEAEERARERDRANREALLRERENQRRALVDSKLSTMFPDLTPFQLEENERVELGTAIPVIEKTARHYAREAVGSLRDTFRETMLRNLELQDELNALRSDTTQLPLRMAIDAQVPDANEIFSSREWRDYSLKPIPSLGVTPDELVRMHAGRKNAAGVINILKEFKAKTKPQRRESAAPSRRYDSRPQSQSRRNQKMLRYSEFESASNKYRNGTLEKAIYDKIHRRFEEAELAGLVDFNS